MAKGGKADFTTSISEFAWPKEGKGEKRGKKLGAKKPFFFFFFFFLTIRSPLDNTGPRFKATC